MEIEMKEDIKYPYIGKAGRHEVIFTSKDSGIDLENFNFYMNGFNEYQFKNITREYLDNTHGKVESKEHAEFIFELGDIDGFSSRTDYTEEYPSWFCFDDDELFFFDNESDANDNGEKLITIPLPPKQIQTATPEEEFEMTQIMKNAGDNLVLGCEDSKCDKWPKIGDEVLVYPNSRRLAEIRDKVVKVIGKCTHSDGSTIITVEHSSLGVFAVAEGSWIKKPKTPEEELRDDIAKQLEVITDNHLSSCGSWIQSITDALLNNKISGLNITKKPQ